MHTYHRWDGTQDVSPLTPEDVLTRMSDPLLSGGIDRALDRALHRGLPSPDDASDGVEGLDSLRDRLRAERKRLEESDELREMLERIASDLSFGMAGGTERIGPDSTRVLDALAADPDLARRVLSRLDDQARATLEAVASSRRADLPGVTSDPLDATPRFDGTIAPSGDVFDRLKALSDLEGRVRGVRRVEDILDVDPALVRSLLGEAASDALARLAASLHGFADSGYLRQGGGRLELSARALQRIGDELLSDVFAQFLRRGEGEHLTPGNPPGHDLTGASRPYQFGDALSLDLSQTVLQAVRRGGGVPVRLDVDDFAVFEREETARSSLVLAIDVSRSMGERGYLLAAKKLALALATLIRARFPRDRLALVAFSETARALTPAELPRLSWDRFGFGTNIHDALRLSRGMLGAHRGLQRSIVLVTDGEPTAHSDATGKVHFNHPPSQETVANTFAEADRCRRDDISLALCVLSDQTRIVRFADELARRSAGRLLTVSPDTLAPSVILHYARSRR